MNSMQQLSYMRVSYNVSVNSTVMNLISTEKSETMLSGNNSSETDNLFLHKNNAKCYCVFF